MIQVCIQKELPLDWDFFFQNVYDSTNPAMTFSQKILWQDTLKIYG